MLDVMTSPRGDAALLEKNLSEGLNSLGDFSAQFDESQSENGASHSSPIPEWRPQPRRARPVQLPRQRAAEAEAKDDKAGSGDLGFALKFDPKHFSLTINVTTMLDQSTAANLIQLQSAVFTEDCRNLIINLQDPRCNLYTISALIALDELCREKDQRLTVMGHNGKLIQNAIDDHRAQLEFCQ